MAYSYTGFSTADIYNSVINDVINGVKEAFLDEDVDLDVLQSIRKEWIDKIEASGCVDKKPTKPHVIPPPIRHLTPVGRVAVQGGIPRTFQMQGGQQYLQAYGDGPHHQLIPASFTSSNTGQQPLLILQKAPMYVAPQPPQPRYIQTADGLVEIQPQDQETDPRVIPHISMYQLDGVGDRKLDEEIVPKSTKNSKVTQKDAKKALHQLMNTVQLDGNGATMSDSSSEDEDFDPLRRLVDKIGKDDHPEEDQAVEEEPPLNSDDDEEGENLDHVFETDNIIICQFEKVNRTRTKWKLNLKDGIMHINNRDHCFTKSSGEATF